MGARGPVPTSPDTLKLRGSYRADRHGGRGQRSVPLGAPTCPQWLPKEAKTEWRKVCKELLALGLLSPCDRAILTAYVLCVAEVEELERLVQVEGRVVQAHGAAVPHPAVKLLNLAKSKVRQLATDLLLTPQSRQRAGVETGDKHQAPDPLEAFLQDGRGIGASRRYGDDDVLNDMRVREPVSDFSRKRGAGGERMTFKPPPPGRPPCPADLNPTERRIWRRACKVLEERGVLAEVDGFALERYCVYLDRLAGTLAVLATETCPKLQAQLRRIARRAEVPVRELEESFFLTADDRELLLRP